MEILNVKLKEKWKNQQEIERKSIFVI